MLVKCHAMSSGHRWPNSGQATPGGGGLMSLILEFFTYKMKITLISLRVLVQTKHLANYLTGGTHLYWK